MRSTLMKTLLAGTAALAIAGTTLAFAQQGPDGRGPERGHHARMSAEDIAAYGDARIAAVHTGLKLTAEQEKNWPAVETALRDLAKQRSDRFAARASADKPQEPRKDPIERLNQRAERMTQTGAALKKLADAAGPLYKSLDDGQKQRLLVLARLGGPEQGGWRGRHGGPGKHHGGPRGPERGPKGPDGGKAPL